MQELRLKWPDGTTQSISTGNYTISELAACFHVLACVFKFAADNPDEECLGIYMKDVHDLYCTTIDSDRLSEFLLAYSVCFECDDGRTNGWRFISGVDHTDDEMIIRFGIWDGWDDFVDGQKTLTETMRYHLDVAREQALRTIDD